MWWRISDAFGVLLMAELSPEKLMARLATGKPIPAIVLLGTDPYLRDLCRKNIIDACVPEAARDWALARVRGDSQGWDEALERVQTMPMLAPRQVIIVEDADLIEQLGDGSRDEIIEALGKYLESPAPFSVLLIEAAALDRRQKFYKHLAEKALLVELTIGTESAASFAAQMAKDLGVEIDKPAAALLAEILNGEPARIRVEIDKLAAYAHDRGRIAQADVEALVVAARKNTVWQLADMLATRERAAAFEFLDNLLREGEEPVRLVGALAWRYRKLVEARGLPRTMVGWQAAKQLGMNPNDAEAAIRNAHRVSKSELLAGLAALAEADSQLKSSNPNPRAFMEFLIARLTSSATSAAPAV
jgi:DNA polymerase-3 subunit delta